MKPTGHWTSISRSLQILPWMVAVLTSIVLFLLLSPKLYGLEILSLPGNWLAWTVALVSGIGVFVLTKWFVWVSQEREKLSRQVHEAQRRISEHNKRLEAVLRVSQKFISASNEKEIIEEVMQICVDMIGARGASYVPLDERGQPLTTINFGNIPDPKIDAWLEYLASPSVRDQCGQCQNYGQWTKTCPLSPNPLSEPVGLYCLPLRHGDQDLGVLNVFMSKEIHLDDETEAFFQSVLNETALALESLRLRKHEMASLRQFQIGETITDLSLLLTPLLESIREILKGDFAFFTGKEPGRGHKDLILTTGKFPEDSQCTIDQLAREVATSGKGVIVGDREGVSPVSGKIHSILAAPVQSQNEPALGVILVGSRQSQSYSKRQLALLQMVAGQVGLLVQNRNILVEVEYNAMMAERKRLAREIHDGLAQTLGFLKLQTAQMQTYLSQGELSRLRAMLESSHKTLSDAYLEARQAIDGLRITPEKKGLTSWLAQTIVEFQDNTGLPVELDRVCNTEDLAPEVQTQLVRILQEALSNVRKHSSATHVWVNCYEERGDLILEIKDDGKGFSLDDIPVSSRYGLQGMRERSDLIGAEFQIISQPVKGTTVRILLPIEESRMSI